MLQQLINVFNHNTSIPCLVSFNAPMHPDQRQSAPNQSKSSSSTSNTNVLLAGIKPGISLEPYCVQTKSMQQSSV
jgi:hypothetical protein